MVLGEYYVHDPRVTLVPAEHLTPSGTSRDFAAFLQGQAGWSAEGVDFFNQAFSLYWTRSEALAAGTRTWPAPRLRHVAVVAEALAVRPYAQMLNTSAWTLYAVDLDPGTSHPELAAYLLALGDRMAVTGEVTLAAVHAAPWWFERSEAECQAFSTAAAASTRPDAEALRAVAAALPWLRELRHETLRPPLQLAGGPAYRAMPGTGLHVPRTLEQKPPALVETWKRVASAAVQSFHARWKAADANAVEALQRWLATDAPPLLVTARGEAILWDPAAPSRLGPLRQELRGASGAGVRDIVDDLRLVAEHTRRFHAALLQPDALGMPVSEPEQRGYAYLHRERRLIAYNLHETWIERLRGPALPYARAMLGARTVHEWCHLAVDAGWVPQVATAARLEQILAEIGERLDEVYRDAPLTVRNAADADLRGLGPRPGRILADGLVGRFLDYRANLLAQRFLSEAERETYVRQNVRTLRGQYRPSQVFRMLARYLYEVQYLRFSLVSDRRAFFLRSTWFEDDFFRSRILDEQRFDTLAANVAQLCEAYAVDESRFAACG